MFRFICVNASLICFKLLISCFIDCIFQSESDENMGSDSPESGDKKGKGRTGWPQHVWASELKQ